MAHLLVSQIKPFTSLMKISTSAQKAFIYSLFFIGNKQKSFPLEQLIDASNVIKKILMDSSEVKDEDRIIGIQFSDTEIELTLDESIFVKKLLQAITEATPSEYSLYQELFNKFTS